MTTPARRLWTLTLCISFTLALLGVRSGDAVVAPPAYRRSPLPLTFPKGTRVLDRA